MGYRDYSFVFIVSYARSGSTLVQSLLNSLAGWQIRGENNNALFHVQKLVGSIRHARNIHGHRPTEHDAPWYGADKLTPRLFADRMLTTFVDGVLKPDDGVTTIGFKEIRHTPYFMTDFEFQEYMEFMLESFPDSRIVFNSRNAEDVCRSAWLKDENPEAVRRDVAVADRRFSEIARTSDRATHLFYDEYVNDHGKIRELFDFLGAEYHPEAIDAVFSKRLTHG